MRVLAPMDGSEASYRALERALDLFGGRPGLHVTLLTVVNAGFEGAPEEVVEEFDKNEDDEIFPNRGSAERALQRAAEACRQRDIPHVREVGEGKPLDVILEACSRHDLLLMHELHRRQFKEKLRGSQTERIARQCGIHVLLCQSG